MSIENATNARHDGGKWGQKYFHNHSKRRDKRSQMVDNNIIVKIEIDIPIFYGEYVIQPKLNTEFHDKPP